MNLMRNVFEPASIGLSCQFRRHRGIKTLNTRLSPVIIDTLNVGHRRSFSTSSASDKPEDKKTRKRVSKEERKSMVETYVKKYRDMNSGKFPTTSATQKAVGGSYYVARQILQEMIYNSKLSPTGKSYTASVNEDTIKEDETSTEKVLRYNVLNRPIMKLDIEDSCLENSELKEETRSSIPVNSDKSKDVKAQFHPKDHLHSYPENLDIEQKTKSEDELKFEEQQSGIPEREFLQDEPAEDAEPQKKQSVWQNLKSFANGIFDIWRKS